MGNEPKPLDLKIDRDPTGRIARLREQGPPSNPVLTRRNEWLQRN
jgi:hypothetical protein